jgi:hypothetical protein
MAAFGVSPYGRFWVSSQAVMMAFCFRVYRTAEQAARYGKWNDALEPRA